MSSSLPATSFVTNYEACHLTLKALDTRFELKKDDFTFGKHKRLIHMFKLEPKAFRPLEPRGGAGGGGGLPTVEEAKDEFHVEPLKMSLVHLSAFSPFVKSAPKAEAPAEKPILTRLIEIAANYTFIHRDHSHLDPKKSTHIFEALAYFKASYDSLTDEFKSLIEDKDFQRFARSIHGAEALFSKKVRAMEKATRLTQGASQRYEESIVLKESYWQEVLLEEHPYGEDIATDYFKAWRKDRHVSCSFEDWLMLRPEAARPSSSVRYLDEAQRAAFEVSIVGGLVYQNDKPLDTSTIKSKKHEGYAIYVISPDYKMYIGPYQVGYFHHSSFLSGAPVIGAGEIQTDATGKILMISSKSGHYKPNALQLHNTFDFLRAHGVNLSKVRLIENHSEGLTRHDSIQEFINASPSPREARLSPFKRGTSSPLGKGGFALARERSASSNTESFVGSRPVTAQAAGGAGGGAFTLAEFQAAGGGRTAKAPEGSPLPSELEF